jgi:hypothetical protein
MDEDDTIACYSKCSCCMALVIILTYTLLVPNESFGLLFAHALVIIVLTMGGSIILFLMYLCVYDVLTFFKVKILLYRLRRIRQEQEIVLRSPDIIIEEDRGEKCTICLDSLGKEGRILECDHKFHVKCIDNWLDGNKTCPNCRNIINV